MNVVDFVKKIKNLHLSGDTEKLIISLLKKGNYRDIYTIINTLMEDCMNLTFQLINHINYIEENDDSDEEWNINDENNF